MRRTLVFMSLVIAGAVAFAGCRLGKAKTDPNATPVPTPAPKVNLIDIKDRPYVTLQPLTERNLLKFEVGTLPKKAGNVEVLLEYDRNKGVMDAVLKSYSLTKIPYTDQIFLGSKSAGGHITYHADVIGGTLTLTFTGAEPYALQVPWRYDDTKTSYSAVSTADQRFQLAFDQPFKTPKIVVMQSPGLPAATEGKVVAGPYIIRGVGPLPQLTGKLTINLSDTYPKAKLLGFSGGKWQEIPASINGRALTATVSLVDAYVVTE